MQTVISQSQRFFTNGAVLYLAIKHRFSIQDIGEPLFGDQYVQMSPDWALIVMLNVQAHPLASRGPTNIEHPVGDSLTEYLDLLNAVDRALAGEASELCRGQVVVLEDIPCCLLYGVGQPDEFGWLAASVSLWLEQFRRSLLKNCPINIKLYVGSIEAFPDGLSQSYLTAMNLKRIDEAAKLDKAILNNADIDWTQKNEDEILRCELQYFNCIMAADFEKAKKLALRLYDLDRTNSAATCINLRSRMIFRLELALEMLGAPYNGNDESGMVMWRLFRNVFIDQASDPTSEEYRASIEAFFDSARSFHVIDHSRTMIDHQVLTYIDNHYSDPDLSTITICQALGISYHHFRQIMVRSAKSGLVDYTHNLRIQAAKKLLLTTDGKIANIARDVGYLSVRTLNRAFLNYEKTTPARFRQINQMTQL